MITEEFVKIFIDAKGNSNVKSITIIPSDKENGTWIQYTDDKAQYIMQMIKDSIIQDY